MKMTFDDLIKLFKPKFSDNPNGTPLSSSDIVEEMKNYRSPLYQQVFSMMTYQYNAELFINQTRWQNTQDDLYKNMILHEYRIGLLIAKTKLPIYLIDEDEEYMLEEQTRLLNALLENAKASFEKMLNYLGEMQKIAAKSLEILHEYNSNKAEKITEYYSELFKALDKEIQNAPTENEKQRLIEIKNNLDYMITHKEDIINDIRERRFNGNNDPETNHKVEQIYNDLCHDVARLAHSKLTDKYENLDAIANALDKIDNEFQPILKKLDEEFMGLFKETLHEASNLECCNDAAKKLGKFKEFSDQMVKDIDKLSDKVYGLNKDLSLELENKNILKSKF